MVAEPDRSLPEEAELLTVLSLGDLELGGRIRDASNTTLYARVSLDGATYGCVYKPIAGERPLWDFPRQTLAKRETAAYALSAATGWRVVPPTVLRDGPFGPGSVQWWVDESATGPHRQPQLGEPGAGLVDVVPAGAVPPGWLRVLDAQGGDGSDVSLVHADHPLLRRMAVFDAVSNNTDRKGGHVLRHYTGAVFGVDHGLTFSVEDKLRTVLWGWSGLPLDAEVCEVLDRLSAELNHGELRAVLSELLSRSEVDRTAERVAALRRRARFPHPPVGWPAIPWPAF